MELQRDINQIFAWWLKFKGVLPKFKKTSYGYRTYDNRWKIFEKTNRIIHTTSTSHYNGYDYDKAVEEAVYEFKQKQKEIEFNFLFTQVI